MKKTYISPNTKVVKLAVNSMICVASPGTLDKDQSISTSAGFGSRGRYNWDDEEEY
jgi:hypothetical protein